MKFQTNPNRVTITRTAERYYVAIIEGNEIGSDSQTRLATHVRKLGFTPEFVDARPKKFKAEHGL